MGAINGGAWWGLTLAAAFLAPLWLAGCSLVTGECEGDRRAIVTEFDVSDTQDDPVLRTEKADLAAALAKEAGIECGTLVVELFGGSVAETARVRIGDVVPSGRTQAARDDALPLVVAGVRETVLDSLASPPPVSGSAPLAALARGARLLAAMPEGVPRILVIVSDGLETERCRLRGRELSASRAQRLAERCLADGLPDLSGISVRMLGLGRVAGRAPSTDFVEGLLEFWRLACEWAGADSWSVVDGMAA